MKLEKYQMFFEKMQGKVSNFAWPLLFFSLLCAKPPARTREYQFLCSFTSPLPLLVEVCTLEKSCMWLIFCLSLLNYRARLIRAIAQEIDSNNPRLPHFLGFP
jgi:hypothetical protein